MHFSAGQVAIGVASRRRRVSQIRRVCEEPRVDRTDDDLLASLVAGDADGFSDFYRRHLPAVTAFFARRVSDREAAFDLTAETFAAVVVSAERFDPDRGPAIAWLLGIASHKLVDSVRRSRVESDARRRLELEPVTMTGADLDQVDDARRSGPDLCDLVDALPPDHRDAVTARIIDERPYPEIAATLECSEAVVRQRVHRGLRRLRDQLDKGTA
jgi:RNA polymerase sigma factor (sigma-70 family)